MAAKRTNKGPGIFRDDDPEAFETEYNARMLVWAMGLARACHRKKCRRRKRCFGPFANDALPCLIEHEGMAKARLESAVRILFPGRSLEDLMAEEDARASCSNARAHRGG